MPIKAIVVDTNLLVLALWLGDRLCKPVTWVNTAMSVSSANDCMMMLSSSSFGIGLFTNTKIYTYTQTKILKDEWKFLSNVKLKNWILI